MQYAFPLAIHLNYAVAPPVVIVAHTAGLLCKCIEATQTARQPVDCCSAQYNYILLSLSGWYTIIFPCKGLRLTHLFSSMWGHNSHFLPLTPHGAKHKYLSLIATHYHTLKGWIKDGEKRRIICCWRRPLPLKGYLCEIVLLECFDMSFKCLFFPFLPVLCSCKCIAALLCHTVGLATQEPEPYTHKNTWNLSNGHNQFHWCISLQPWYITASMRKAIIMSHIITDVTWWRLCAITP